MIIRLKVFEQTLSIIDTKSIPRKGSKDYLVLHFLFSSDWKDLNKICYLQHGEVSQPIDVVDNLVEVPEWFTQQDSFDVTLFGKSGSQEVPTNVVSLRLEKSNTLWEQDAPEPQPSWLAKVIDLNNHPSIPGGNGYWLIWDTDKGAYVESELPLPAVSVGPQGPKGDTGATGPAGAGVPDGGTAGQLLSKTESGTEWIDPPQSGVQQDWNQNDDTQPDYVKNRPFYTGDPVETVIIPETTVTFSEMDGLMAADWPESFDLVDGQTYKISWDGTDYVCTGILFNGAAPILGNLGIIGMGDDTGEPFIFMNQGQWSAASTESATEHIISISVFAAQVVKIDEKYLPISTDDSYGVIKKSDIVSAYNFPANAPHDQMVDAINAFNTGNASIVWGGDKVIRASYDSSADTISVTFALEPLKTLTFSNNNGSYVKTLGTETYGELQGIGVRIVNDNGVYTALYTEGISGDTTLKVGAQRIYANGVELSSHALILVSSTENSLKRFKITVDDSGTISATEVT